MADEAKTGEPQDAGATQTPDLSELGESGVHQDAEARQSGQVEGGQGPATTKTESWTDKVPEKFRSASAEEAAVKAATAYLEVEKEKGRLAQEQGELRRVVEFLASERQRYMASSQPPPPEQTPEPEAKADVDFYGDPEGSARKIAERIVNEKLGALTNAIGRAQVASVFQRAEAAHEQGKSIMSKESRLFEGIEKDVEGAVFDSLRPYAMQGHDVSQQLLDPQTWRMAAAMLRYSRGEYDRLTPNQVKGMTATPTEIPGSTKPQEDEGEVAIDERDRRMAMASFIANGMDEKSAREAVQRVAKKTIGRNI